MADKSIGKYEEDYGLAAETPGPDTSLGKWVPCRVCKGEGWLPEMPPGRSACPGCMGQGVILVPPPVPRVPRPQ